MQINKLPVMLGLTAVLSIGIFSQTERPMPPDFKSDGCSLFPDCNYRECCVEHDKDYYFGGTSAERRASDKRLYKCVKAKRNRFTASMMWVGVRLGGVSFLPTPFRWGFGNKYPRSKPETAKPKVPEKPTGH